MKPGFTFGIYAVAAVLISGLWPVAGSAQQRTANQAPSKTAKDPNAPFPDEDIDRSRNRRRLPLG